MMKVRNDVRTSLIQNARRISEEYQNEILKWKDIVLAEIDRRKHFLPAYIPYIGSQYFAEHTEGHRILAYALSQNLTQGANWTKEWAVNWHKGDGEIALDRQNHAYETNNGHAAMHPFDTGHIPILCAMVKSLVTKNTSMISISIYNEIAATNLSKFSFRRNNKTIDNEECLRRCWEWFSQKEFELLKPNYILCVSSSVYNIVREGIRQMQMEGHSIPAVLKVAFPSLRVINRWYRKKRTHDHLKPGEILAFLSENDRKRLTHVVERDDYYFAEMYDRLKRQMQ